MGSFKLLVYLSKKTKQTRYATIGSLIMQVKSVFPVMPEFFHEKEKYRWFKKKERRGLKNIQKYKMWFQYGGLCYYIKLNVSTFYSDITTIFSNFAAIIAISYARRKQP